MSKVIHTCTGCVPIDKSIIDVYVALLSADKSVTEAETARVEAENARIAAETARDLAESSRKSAEDAREATSSADHATAIEDHAVAEADHTTAEADHDTASSDHTSSVEATEAADTATARANAAAAAAEHMVDIHRGPKGDQGNTGSSVDYPYELVNNLTTDDATKGLSAAQGVALDDKISQLGQQVIYDVSANNDGATFASLSALFSSENLSTLIPTAVRCGGMSIRFVQTSDNKYIQYRLRTQSFTTIESAWAVCFDSVYLEDTKYIYVNTDAENKQLEARKKDGTKIEFSDLEVKGRIINQEIQNDREIISYFETANNPNWLQVCIDSERKLLGGRRIDGTLVEYCDVEYPNGIPSEIKRYVDANADKKNIKALFIGNSVSQDHITYLPWLLKNTYPHLDFEIYIAYIGGITIKEYVEDVVTGNHAIDIFSEAKNTDVWTNYNNSVYWNDIWNFATYDIISYEGYFNDLVEDTTYFSQFTNAVKSAQSSPFKFAYLMHQTYGRGSNSESVIWNAIVDGAEQALLTTPVDMLIPCGAVTKLLLNTWSLSFLTPDNTHNNEGLPCIMGAYVVMETIAEYLGLKSKVINNQLRITSEKYWSMNIPGPNGTLQIGTEEQYKQAQDAAILAIKWSNSLFNETCKSIIQ